MAVSDFEVPVCDFKVAVSDFEVAVSDFKVPVIDFEVPVNDFEVPVNDFKVAVRDFKVPVSDDERRDIRIAVAETKSSAEETTGPQEFVICNFQFSICNSVDAAAANA